jgi:hypothetical protein
MTEKAMGRGGVQQTGEKKEKYLLNGQTTEFQTT